MWISGVIAKPYFFWILSVPEIKGVFKPPGPVFPVFVFLDSYEFTYCLLALLYGYGDYC